MVALLLISIGIVFVGIAGSLVLMARSGEIRVGLFTLCFTLLAVHQGVALWLSWDAPLGFDAAGGAEVSMVVVCGVGLLILAALWKTLLEWGTLIVPSTFPGLTDLIEYLSRRLLGASLLSRDY